MKKKLPDEQEKVQHNMVSELPNHYSFTTNQPIGSTVSNTPIFSDGANPPAHQGSMWQSNPKEIPTLQIAESGVAIPTIKRVWAMPSFATFTIKPIAELLLKYNVGKNWIDPFAGNNSPAEITNDHNPETKATYHFEALEFVKRESNRWKKFDGALFDPPYSYRQVSEHYRVLGKKATQLDTSTNFYNRVLNPLADIIKKGGFCISFGWNTNAMGKNRGFEIVEILIVAHGGHHNDTLVTVEQKIVDGVAGEQELNIGGDKKN